LQYDDAASASNEAASAINEAAGATTEADHPTNRNTKAGHTDVVKAINMEVKVTSAVENTKGSL